MSTPEDHLGRGPDGRDDQLRTLLDDAVSGVEPGYALNRIQARTADGRSHRRRVRRIGAAVLATVATVVAVAALGPGLGLGGALGGDPEGGTAGTGNRAGVASQPDGSASPVFYVGSTGAGPRLFAEPGTAPSGASVLDAAVAAAVTGVARDPDYRSPWPAGTTMQRAQLSDGTLSVDLGGDVADRPSGMTQPEAALAVQQLVYTAQAAADRQLPVTFLLDGEPTSTLLGEPADRPVAAAAPDNTLSPVSIGSLAEGARVTSPFTVSGKAAAFEANVQWELMDGDTVVKQGFATAEECCTLSPYSFQVTAPPGEYTLVVHDEDASDGEGAPPTRDTRTVVVE
jgi:hypothetical protein